MNKVKQTLMEWLWWLFNPATDWRSWAGHGVVTLAVELVIPGGYGAVWYTFREVEQALQKVKKRQRGPVVTFDAVMDVLVPWVVTGFAQFARVAWMLQ